MLCYKKHVRRSSSIRGIRVGTNTIAVVILFIGINLYSRGQSRRIFNCVFFILRMSINDNIDIIIKIPKYFYYFLNIKVYFKTV